MSIRTGARKLRSLVLKSSRGLMCYARIFRAKLLLDGVSIPWSATLGRGVFLQATDGGSIVIGARTYISPGCHLTAQGGGVVIGADCFIGIGCVITCKSGIDIGDDALIAEYVTIRDQDHAFPAGARIREAGFDTSPVTIGSDVWLAAKSSVLKGSRIGVGCVVGAHTVVKGVVPGNSVVAGIPVRLVRERVHGR